MHIHAPRVVIRARAGYHSGMTKTNDTVRSVCPHDCPSVCALDVQLLSPERIGRIRGAAQPYTDGVICAKVARYAERVHHPDRLMHPLRRIGAKGSGQFEPITWDDALDLIATRLQSAIAKHGPETVWPYHYAGTMGQVQGESMVNAGILDGDLVLVEQQATAENGEKIVALVNDSATVKTFYKEDGYFRLQPENDEMDPILVNDLQIVGKVIGVLRFLS